MADKKAFQETQVTNLTIDLVKGIIRGSLNDGTGNWYILISDLKVLISPPAIIVTAGSFTGNNAPAIAALAGLTPDTQFLVYSGGTLLDHSLSQYTFAGTTITIPTGAATLRVVIL